MQSTNWGANQRKLPILLLRGAVALCLVPLPISSSSAQSTEEKRSMLASVKRVVVVAPFFGTSTLLGEEPPKAGKTKPRPPSPPPTAEQERQRQTYLEYLHKIEAKMEEHLPSRLQKRTSLAMVTQEQVKEAFKALDMTPQKLFQSGGKIKNTKFPQGESEMLAKLTRQLKADAILLLVLDEPRRTNGALYASGLGFYYESAHVRAKGGFSLYLADGKRVLQEPVEVLHPLTKIGKKEFLLTDWMEAHEQLIENFMDELVRYVPPKTTP